jgi:cell division transport system ATP-binding protein
MISLTCASVQYPNALVPALTEVSAEIGVGEFVFLVGSTGAGKSTLLKLLYGDATLIAGAASVLGYDLRSLTGRDLGRLRRQMGIILQDYGLLPERTVWENVAFVCHVLGFRPNELRRRVGETLEQVGMHAWAERFPRDLSGGEQQRVAIARALVAYPALLLADEPTGNLDPDTSAGIMQLLLDANKRGATVVVATHDKTTVDRLRQRVIAVEGGRVVRDERGGIYDAPAGG